MKTREPPPINHQLCVYYHDDCTLAKCGNKKLVTKKLNMEKLHKYGLKVFTLSWVGFSRRSIQRYIARGVMKTHRLFSPSILLTVVSHWTRLDPKYGWWSSQRSVCLPPDSVSAPTHPTTHPQTPCAGPQLESPKQRNVVLAAFLLQKDSTHRQRRHLGGKNTERAILALTMHSCHKSSCLLTVRAVKEQKKPPVMRIKGR